MAAFFLAIECFYSSKLKASPNPAKLSLNPCRYLYRTENYDLLSFSEIGQDRYKSYASPAGLRKEGRKIPSWAGRQLLGP